MSATGGIELPAPARPVRREHVPLGILYMVGATILFAGSSAGAKWLVATYPFTEILFARQFASMVVCALIIMPFSGLAVFRTKRLRAHGVRRREW